MTARTLPFAAVAFASFAACRDDRGASGTAVPVVPQRQPADASLRELPASARASYVPPPRDRWPCAVEVNESQGIQARGRNVFDYERTVCQMPHDLIAQGIWGCPARFVRTDTDGMVRRRTFRYDAAGRLTQFDGGNFIQTFTWDGDRLSSITRSGDADPANYVDHGAQVVAVDPGGRPREVLAFEDERVVRIDEYIYGSVGAVAKITWLDGRPVDVQVEVRGPVRGSVTRKFLYDCAD